MQFNKILKDLRTELGYTQTQLAKKSKLAPSCIAMLETAKREPTANTLMALSRALNVTTDYLLGLEDDFGAKISAPTVLMSDEYSSEERKLVEQYRSLPDKLKQLVRQQLEIYTAPSGLESLSKSTKK